MYPSIVLPKINKTQQEMLQNVAYKQGFGLFVNVQDMLQNEMCFYLKFQGMKS